MKDALCAKRGMPTEYFFDEYMRSREVFDEVNATCRACPVRKTCYRYGKATKSTGIWGGKWLQYGQTIQVVFGDVIDDED
jgi:hypothetical protein